MSSKNIGLPDYQKNMSMQEILKTYYNKAEIGNSIFVVHKKSKNHNEYKFFSTSYQGKDYVLVAPKHWNCDFATHSDLMEIAFNLIGIQKADIRRKLELYKTEFFENAFHGTIGKNPKENKIHFHCLDESPDPTIKRKKLNRIPEGVQKVHKRLFNSLNRVVQSNRAIARARAGTNMPKPRPKSKTKKPKQKAIRVKPRVR